MKSPARWVPAKGRWVDADGKTLDGPAPLAQLGVGGQWIDRRGRTVTIQKIVTDERGFVYVVGTGQL